MSAKTNSKNKTKEIKKSKTKDSKKKKIIIGLGISLPIITIGTVSTIVIVEKSKVTYWEFTQDDYNNFRENIILEKISFQDFNSNLLTYSKKYLKASNKDISSLIENVSIIEKLDNSITFKVILNSNKNIFSCVQSSKFKIINNELILEYSGNNNITFTK